MPLAKTKSNKNLPDQQSQKTIAEHFALSKQGVKTPATDDLPGPSPNKRLKSGHHFEAMDLPPPNTTSRTNGMYNFSTSARRTPSDIIDLTSTTGISSDFNASPLSSSKNGMRRPSNCTPSSGPKKLVVKNLRKSSAPSPDQYYGEVWARLEASLAAIFEHRAVPYSKETLYNEVRMLCRLDKASKLQEDLEEKLANNIRQHSQSVLNTQDRIESNVEFLRFVADAWNVWTEQLERIKEIFFFLDRSYLLHARLPSIVEMGVEKFRSAIVNNSMTSSRTVEGACELVRMKRDNLQPSFDESLLHNAVKMFRELSMYGKMFEPAFLAVSQAFYVSWAEQTTASTDLSGYIEMTERAFVQEMDSVEAWGLDATTRKQLEMYLEEILIVDGSARLCDKADTAKLFKQGKKNDLHRIFLLLQRRGLGHMLKPSFENFILEEGSSIVFDETREQEMVSRLLDFKKALDDAWELSFERHTDLGHTLREAFETFINKSKRSSMTWGTDNPKPGEMIAKYVDAVLKGGAKAVRAPAMNGEDGSRLTTQEQDQSSDDDDTEIAKQLDQVLDLFRFVHGKAVFEAFYKRDLARRLLMGRSASSDAEKSMLTRLKSECGAGFTHNLEQMFKDIEMARDEMASYRIALEGRNANHGFDLNVNVLSSSAWPSYPDASINVPENVLIATADFERNYKMKHSGRKLEWKHALAHCQLKAYLPKGSKEIVVSCFQAIVLLSFNDANAMSYSQLQTVTGLDHIELKRTLQSLACAKYRLLAKTPKGKDVLNGDSFAVNQSFHHAKYRIKINQIQAKETKQENQQTHERVAADRAFETQAAIVRIMKSRKTITHAELVSEVIKATKSRGPLDPADIKKNIEKLIDKDYMERDEEAHNTYSYVA